MFLTFQSLRKQFQNTTQNQLFNKPCKISLAQCRLEKIACCKLSLIVIFIWIFWKFKFDIWAICFFFSYLNCQSWNKNFANFLDLLKNRFYMTEFTLANVYSWQLWSHNSRKENNSWSYAFHRFFQIEMLKPVYFHFPQ